MLISVFAVAASAQSVAAFLPTTQVIKPNAGLFKSFAAKLEEEIDDPIIDDMGGEQPFSLSEMTREEFIEFFMPDNASENLKAFVELFFGMLYDELNSFEDPDIDYPEYDEDVLAFETVDEYLQYMIDQNMIDQRLATIADAEQLDEAFLKLTDDDLQLLADKLNEIIAYLESQIETPDDIDPDYVDPDYDDSDFDVIFTVDDLKAIHDSIVWQIDYLQQEIEILQGFIGSDTFEEDIKTLAKISALLSEAQDDCKISYYNDAQERFYNEYENAFEGYPVTFEDLEYFGVTDYVDYFFNGISESSFVLYLYADIDDMSDKQIANFKEVQSLFATLHSDVLDCLSTNACGSIADFADSLVEYVGSELKYGDANNDGVIDMLDVLLIRKYIAKQPVTLNLDAADVTSDGVVDMLDVLLIRKYIAKQPVELGPKG